MLVIPVPVLAPVPNPELEDCEAPPGAFDDAAAPLPNENDDFAGGRAVLVDSLIPPPALPNAKPLPLAFAAGIDSLDVLLLPKAIPRGFALLSGTLFLSSVVVLGLGGGFFFAETEKVGGGVEESVL